MGNKYIIYVRKSSEDKKRQIQSIDDQKRELLSLAKQRGLGVIDIIADERSAKSPGRMGFTQMIKKLEKGEASGILCWKLDRLARNPVDGGSITWLLQQGTISEIVTPEKIYYPQDNVILMGIEFGMANQYIIDLRKNVKRGMNSKVEKGWMPTRAPLGYKNETTAVKGTKKILPDPEIFPVVQNLWRLLLTERYSLARLYDYMKRESPLYIHSKLIYFSSFHRIFHNPFYCGIFKWNGQDYLGLHEIMLTQSEFERIQQIIGRKQEVRQRKLQFDFKGLFRCGYCGSMITAEAHKKFVKQNGDVKTYNYYKCPRHKRSIDCHEKSVAESLVEEGVQNIIDSINIPQEIIDFGLLKMDEASSPNQESVKEKQIKKAITDLNRKIDSAGENISVEADSEIRTIILANINKFKIQIRALEQELISSKQNTHFDRFIDNLTVIRESKIVLKSMDIEQKRRLLNNIGSNWKIAGKKVDCEPHFATSLLKKTKEFYLGEQSKVRTKNNRFSKSKEVISSASDFFWSG